MSKSKNVLLWIAAIFIMVSIAAYQRLTGPTHPINGDVKINNEIIDYSLLTSYGGEGNAEIKFLTNDENISGSITYKRYKSHDEWTRKPLVKKDSFLVAQIPHQPKAGKVEYTIALTSAKGAIQLTDEPVVIRFKGHVPKGYLAPHIILMFFAMCFSMRTGFEALFGGTKTYGMAMITVILFLLGGLILGPIVQKFAFGEYWTGWPFGHDLTDNKTIAAFIIWLIALWRLKKNPNAKAWAIAASLILLAVYLIPHSVLGSEIDYTKMPGN